MFIVFEGPDSSGKTTLAKALANHVGGEYQSGIVAPLAGLREEADALSPMDRFCFYRTCNALKGARLLADQGSHIVLDRYIYSTAAYHQLLLGDDLTGYVAEFLGDSKYRSPDLVVYVTAEPAIRRSRALSDGTANLWLDVSMDSRLEESYSSVMAAAATPVVLVDTTFRDADSSSQWLMSELERRGLPLISSGGAR
ncbi:AAA family ATPase [Arthrobacter sp. Cr_A7]|uniref:AAA family ATPase n=1 Tax=Arthrobacter sp. Cr_A7 TaxID=3031017 RepID=UPI0023DC8975|nr:AAA family ATPase [Arthrobacter sp. Cr_A7]MDF2051174.1 AAA family ATPase [Arthrobacter sp. Cr_A7]